MYARKKLFFFSLLVVVGLEVQNLILIRFAIE